MPCYFIYKIHSLGVGYRTRQPWQNQKYQKGRNTIKWCSRITLFTTAPTSLSGVSPPKMLLWRGEHPTVPSSLQKSHPTTQPGRDHCSEVISQWHGWPLRCHSVAWLAHCLQPLFLIITGKFSVYNLRTGDTVVLEHTYSVRTSLGHMELDLKLWPHLLQPQSYTLFLFPLLYHMLGQRVCYWN